MKIVEAWLVNQCSTRNQAWHHLCDFLPNNGTSHCPIQRSWVIKGWTNGFVSGYSRQESIQLEHGYYSLQLSKSKVKTKRLGRKTQKVFSLEQQKKHKQVLSCEQGECWKGGFSYCWEGSCCKLQQWQVPQRQASQQSLQLVKMKTHWKERTCESEAEGGPAGGGHNKTT